MVESKSRQKIEIGQLIDQRGLSALQILVMVLSGMVVLLDGYHIQNMPLVVPWLAKQWSLKPSAFSWVLTAAPVGIALGGAFLGPLGDRWGRRTLMITSMLAIGVSSIFTGYATGIMQLTIWRFLTGLGLGASLPNAIALTSEYVPSKRRAALITIMYSGVPIGAFTAGFVADPIMNAFGWPGVFTIGGALPLLVCVLLAAAVPESLKLLLARAPNDPRIPRILARLAPEMDAGLVYAEQQRVVKQSFTELLRPNYLRGTLLLWEVFIFNIFVLYLLVNWLPTLLKTQGWLPADANRGAVMIQAGGVVGGLMLAWCVDRGKTVVGMLTAYLATAIALGLFIVLPSTGMSWWVLILIVGAGISGGQFALNALAAAFYPPVIRATGVGWAMSIGRLGAIVSGLVGFLLALIQPFAVLGLLVIPVLLCVAGVLMFRNIFHPAPVQTSAQPTATKPVRGVA